MSSGFQRVIPTSKNSSTGRYDPASNTNPLPVKLSVADTVGNINKVVAVTGTPIVLASPSTEVNTAIITALDYNNAMVAIGGTGVSYVSPTMNGCPLYVSASPVRPDSLTLSKVDLNDVYVTGTAGDGVSVVYTK